MENKPIEVRTRVVFLKIEDVNTKNESFAAEVFIESCWEDDNLYKKLYSDKKVDKKQANNELKKLQYDSNIHWSPELFVENAIGEFKQEIKHRFELIDRSSNQNSKDYTILVIESRKLKSNFYERLELYDFPMDLQEISIKITSKRSLKEVIVLENQNNMCTVNKDGFLVQQEWDLFEYLRTQTDNVNDDWRKLVRSQFSVSCLIVRKTGFYLYNAYMLVFLITTLGFTPFSFAQGSPQFRCQVTGLLILTSVNFRWVITQRLPSVSYLTSLDKYAIGCLTTLVLFCIWHSLIGSEVITSSSTTRKSIDEYFLIASACTYALFNFIFIIWFIKMNVTISRSKNANKTISMNKQKEINKTNLNMSRLERAEIANRSVESMNSGVAAARENSKMSSPGIFNIQQSNKVSVN